MGEGDAQYSQLASWVAEWQRRPTDSPRSSGETLLWIDRACLPPGNVSVGLTCLPIFVAGSRRLLVLAGTTYSSRLWCAMELWMFVQMEVACEQLRNNLLTHFGPCYLRVLHRSLVLSELFWAARVLITNSYWGVLARGCTFEPRTTSPASTMT